MIDALRRYKETEELPEHYCEVEEDRGMIEELHEQIGLLEEPDRSIVRLQLQGFSYEEIGERMKMTEKNVSVRLVRAKEKLKKMMGVVV